jgi:phytoene synthase
VEPTIATVEEWRAYLSGSAGSVAVAAGRLLGAPEPEELRPAGVAYGIAGLLRSIPAHARQQRCLLPDDVLAAHGLTPERVIAEPGSARPVAAVLARQGIAMLHSMRLPRHAIAAALPAVLARRDLGRAPAIRPQRGLGDRLAVTIAGLACRI